MKPKNPNGDTTERRRKRAERAALAARLALGTVRNAVLPVHVSTLLVKQRVEVVTRAGDERGVVIEVDVPLGVIVLAEAGEYDPRGFWTPTCGRIWARSREEMVRLTVLDGSGEESEGGVVLSWLGGFVERRRRLNKLAEEMWR